MTSENLRMLGILTTITGKRRERLQTQLNAMPEPTADEIELEELLLCEGDIETTITVNKELWPFSFSLS